MMCELCRSNVGIGPIHQCGRCGAQACERCMTAGNLCRACDEQLADEEYIAANEDNQDDYYGREKCYPTG